MARDLGEGVPSLSMVNPMQPMTREPLPLRSAPRCGARTRAGNSCKSPRVKGKRRCRMHGGGKGSGAPKGSRNGNFKHGAYTCEAIEERRRLRLVLAEAGELLRTLR
jgi:hypothetical protein